MSNHQSHYDIPVLFQALKLPLRMVAKTELFRIPVMGKAMSDSGFIEIDRSNRKSSIESLKRARSRLLDDHLSVWIAPEGTRSVDGVLGRFKTGGFHLAIDAGIPILPVAIDGTHKIHRSGDWRVHREQAVSVTIAPPIDVSGYTRAEIPALSERVRRAIAAPLGQL
jgi:1-acyl-sn-glycerol-3-phosphate acyltransferase